MQSTQVTEMDDEHIRLQGDVTQLLQAVSAGDSQALDRLVPLVYEELRSLAKRELYREQQGHTLHATALVHEAYLKLAGSRMPASDRAHFLAIAARAMRQVLVDHARRRKAVKRGGDMVCTTLTDGGAPVDFRPDELIEAGSAPAPDRRIPVLRRDGGKGNRRRARSVRSNRATGVGEGARVAVSGHVSGRTRSRFGPRVTRITP